MNDEKSAELLSALMDGELPQAKAQRTLDQLLGDEQLRERWRRNHLISAALSARDSAGDSARNSAIVADDELANRVSAALDQEAIPAIETQRPTSSRRSSSWTMSLAAAAGVAAVAVLVALGVANAPSGNPEVSPLANASPAANSTPSAPDLSAGQIAVVEPPAAVSTVALTASTPLATAQAQRSPAQEPIAREQSASALTRMTWNDARPAVEARLNGYLLDHNEYLADGVRGMLPYARVVGYDARN